MSDTTKKYRIKYWICTILSYLLTFGSLVYFVGYGFYHGETTEKITLGISAIAAIFLTVISAVFKFHIRSTIFILILGIYFCLDTILPTILTICACTILDEFVVSPLRKMYHQKLVINKEIDKR